MSGSTFDTAIGDYLQAIARTRPWTKQREEELLKSLMEWLSAQPEQSGDLASVTPTAVRRYCEMVGLDDSDQDDLQTAMTRFHVWADINGYPQITAHIGNTAN